MIKITFQKQNGEYKSVISEGHAEFAESGEDIVCSAVSVLLINTANSLESFTDSLLGSDSDDGVLTIVLKDMIDEKARVLMDSLKLGLETVRDEYGEDYLQIDYKEV
jgi:uncharacterized protein YsxB (DUF464 family)